MTELPDIDRLRDLTGIKWSRFDDDIIPAWVADMDLPPAPPITEALSEMVEAGDLGYNGVSFDDRVVTAWADWSERRYGWRPDPEHSRMWGDVLQPISTILDVTTEPDNVASQRVIEKAGGRFVERFRYPSGYDRADGLRYRVTPGVSSAL